jgi:membrane-associated protease RseP (regulator of RpoE activity)
MNLMPLFITDGGQILRVFLQTHFRKETALLWYSRICSTAFWIIVIAFVVPFVVKFVG